MKSQREKALGMKQLHTSPWVRSERSLDCAPHMRYDQASVTTFGPGNMVDSGHAL
jgi:hypothetical protein